MREPAPAESEHTKLCVGCTAVSELIGETGGMGGELVKIGLGPAAVHNKFTAVVAGGDEEVMAFVDSLVEHPDAEAAKDEEAEAPAEAASPAIHNHDSTSGAKGGEQAATNDLEDRTFSVGAEADFNALDIIAGDKDDAAVAAELGDTALGDFKVQIGKAFDVGFGHKRWR